MYASQHAKDYKQIYAMQISSKQIQRSSLPECDSNALDDACDKKQNEAQTINKLVHPQHGILGNISFNFIV